MKFEQGVILHTCDPPLTFVTEFQGQRQDIRGVPLSETGWHNRKDPPTLMQIESQTTVPSHPMVGPGDQQAHHPYGLSKERTAKIRPLSEGSIEPERQKPKSTKKIFKETKKKHRKQKAGKKIKINKKDALRKRREDVAPMKWEGMLKKGNRNVLAELPKGDI